MTQVDFHTGLADKLGYACRLLRKACRAGSRVVVAGSGMQLSRLDTLLWTFEVGEFIPHVRLRPGEAPAPRLARTPVWLAERPGDAGDCDVLVNLGPAPVDAPGRYGRIFELVATPADEVAAGRQRWRQYVAAGLAPVNHPQVAP